MFIFSIGRYMNEWLPISQGNIQGLISIFKQVGFDSLMHVWSRVSIEMFHATFKIVTCT